MTLTITKDITINTKPKIGRNDPCFCGSGKKYKKCCIDKEATYIPKQGEVKQMVDWLYAQDFFQNIVKELSTEIFGEDHIFDEKDMHAVTETAIYEGRVNGKAPIELFLAKAPLTSEDLQKYTTWKEKNIFSIFEVLGIDYGKSLTVGDLYTNKKYLVYERLGTYGSEIGMLLATRILPMDTDWVFSGGILLPMPEELGYSLKRMGKKLTGTLTQTEVLKAVFGKKGEENIFQEQIPKNIDPNSQPGQIEQMLIRQMMLEAQDLNINQQKSQAKADKQFSGFAQNWLDIPQTQLDGKTPKQAILEERKKLGNPHKELAYKFSVTKIPGGMDNAYIEAVDLMQNKQRYLEALKLFASVKDPLGNLEEPFRYLCNVGACLVYLGQMELGKKYFEESLKLNPNYKIAQNNLQNFQDSQIIENMRFQGLQKLFFESIDENFSVENRLATDKPFLRDVTVFLEYIAHYSPEVTKIRREITFKHLLGINSGFIKPNPTTLMIKGGRKKLTMDYKRQVQFPKVNFLHNTCLAGRLIKEEKGKLKVTDQGQKFLNLPPGQQFGVVFSAFFSKLDWQALNGADNLRGNFLAPQSEILQHTSYAVFKAIQNFQNTPFSAQKLLEKILPKTKQDDIGMLMLSMMIDRLLLDYLVWMEILESDLDKLKDQPEISILATLNYSLTSFGNKVTQQIDQTMQNSIPIFFYQLI